MIDISDKDREFIVWIGPHGSETKREIAIKAGEDACSVCSLHIKEWLYSREESGWYENDR